MYSRKKLTWARWIMEYIPTNNQEFWQEPKDYAHLAEEKADSTFHFYESTQESDTESDALLDIEIYDASLTTTESYSESE